MTSYENTRLAGFTIVELLVTMGIVAILMGLAFPAIQHVREAARRSSCSNRQRQLILALHTYEASFQQLPPTLSIDQAHFLNFWQARLLPFFENDAIAASVKNEVLNGIHVYNSRLRTTNISLLQCISNPDKGQLVQPDAASLFAFTDYCGVAGSDNDNGMFPLEIRPEGIEFSQVVDGLSNALCFGERPPSDYDEGFGSWLGGQTSLGASTYTNGNQFSFPSQLVTVCNRLEELGFSVGERGNRCDWTHHWSFHPGGANFSVTDGSIKFISYSIDFTVLDDLASVE